MKLVSVNVSMPKTVDHQGRTVSTGIFNKPVTGRAMVHKLNVEGDGQADLTVHGGVYKAVYFYDFKNIRYWRQELGRSDLGYGHFGENFTVEEMRDDRIHIGDVFRIGGALLEVTQPRTCQYELMKGTSTIHSNLLILLTRIRCSSAAPARDPIW